MSSVSPDIVDQFTDLDKKLESMDEKGFGNDVNSKVRNDRDKKQKQVYTKMIESFSDISSGNRRKKRSSEFLCFLSFAAMVYMVVFQHISIS